MKPRMPSRTIDFDDFLLRTRHLSPVAMTCYLRLISYYWTMGELPESDNRAAELCGVDVRTLRRLDGQLGLLFDVDAAGRRRDYDLEAERERVLAEARRTKAAAPDGARA